LFNLKFSGDANNHLKSYFSGKPSIEISFFASFQLKVDKFSLFSFVGPDIITD